MEPVLLIFEGWEAFGFPFLQFSDNPDLNVVMDLTVIAAILEYICAAIFCKPNSKNKDKAANAKKRTAKTAKRHTTAQDRDFSS